MNPELNNEQVPATPEAPVYPQKVPESWTAPTVEPRSFVASSKGKLPIWAIILGVAIVSVLIFGGVSYYLYSTNKANNSINYKSKVAENSKVESDALSDYSCIDASINKVSDIINNLSTADHKIFTILYPKQGALEVRDVCFSLPNKDTIYFNSQGDGTDPSLIGSPATLDQAVTNFISWFAEQNKVKVILPAERISTGVYIYGFQFNHAKVYYVQIVEYVSDTNPFGNFKDGEPGYTISFSIDDENSPGKYNEDAVKLVRKMAESAVVEW